MRGLKIFLGTLLLLQLFVSSTSALRPVDLGKHSVPKSRKSRHGPRADLSLRLRGGQDAGEKKEATEKKEEVNVVCDPPPFCSSFLCFFSLFLLVDGFF